MAVVQLIGRSGNGTRLHPYVVGILHCADGLRQRLGASDCADQRSRSGSKRAVLPGVEVTATQTETGVRRTTVTNETGCSNSFAMICLTRRRTSRQWIRRP